MEYEDEEILGLPDEERKLVADLEFKFSKYNFKPKSFNLNDDPCEKKEDVVVVKEKKNGRRSKGTSNLF